MNKRYVLITGSTETLGYFSKQIAAFLCERGEEVFVWDMKRPLESVEAFEKLPEKEKSILITFNFVGLCGEGQFACGLHNVWDEYDVNKICIMVDSPIYYFDQLSSHMPRLSLVCIDRNHLEYVKRWYPEYAVSFIPLHGNLPIDDLWFRPGLLNKKDIGNHSHNIIIKDYEPKRICDRHIDISFIGNFVTVDSIMPAVSKVAPEYADFLYETADELIKNPDKVLEEELFDRLKSQFPDEEEENYPEAMFHMVFIDLFVRTYYRCNMVKVLSESGYKIHLVGKDWDKMETSKPENLIYTSQMMTSADCVTVLNDSKLSLNIMPWFKDGSHDRIFSSMLASCVCVTDSSKYLDEVITPWKDYVPFSLGHDEELVCNVEKVLNDENLAEIISFEGRQLAKSRFTWKEFSDILTNIYAF